MEPMRGQPFSRTWFFKCGKQGHPHVLHHAHALSLPSPKPNLAGNLPATWGSAWRPGTNESEEKRERRKMHESQILVERVVQEREKDKEDGANGCCRLETTCSSLWLGVHQPLSLTLASLLPVLPRQMLIAGGYFTLNSCFRIWGGEESVAHKRVF